MKSKTLFVWILIFCFVGFAFGAPDQADDDEDEDEQEKGPDDNKRNDTEKEDNKICHDLKNKNFDGKNGILAVGLTSKNLILVTLSFHVFMVPSDTLDGAINNLYLNQKAKPMSEIWPKMWNNDNFMRIKDKYIWDSFLVMDKDDDYFCASTKQSETNLEGVCYSIKEKKVFRGYSFTGSQQEVVVSADKPIIYYLMQKVTESVQICRYRFSGSSIEDSDIVINSTWRNFCQSKDKIFTSEKKCEKPFPMPLLNGFTSRDKFFLFDVDHVMIFSIDVFHKLEEKLPVVMKKYNQFIVCKRGNIVTTKKSFSVGIIIAVIMGILLLILCCVLLLTRVAKKERKSDEKKEKSHTKKASKTSQQHSDKNLKQNSNTSKKSMKNASNASTAKSARSGVSFKDKISKRTSNVSVQKSARSTQMPSVKNLSKNASSKSKRSSHCSSNKSSKHNKNSKFNNGSVDCTARST